jgi:iron(III) transport system substrate-binding protein
MKRHTARWAVAALAVALIAGCSAPPTSAPSAPATSNPPATSAAAATSPATAGSSASASSDPGSSSPAPTSEAPAGGPNAFDAVYAAVKDLKGEERTKKLVELANAEGNFTIYTSNTDMQEFADGFEDLYKKKNSGLTARPQVYRAPADQVLQRLLQEDQAKFYGADLTEIHSHEITAMDEQNLLSPFTSPVLDGRDKQFVYPDWAVTRVDAQVIAWNEEIPEAERPKSYEDLADPKFKGKLMLEARAYDWYSRLYQYFTEEKGWTEQQADEYFNKVAENSAAIVGFPLVAQLLTTGEFGLAANVYPQQVFSQQQDGAPVSYEPLISPIIAAPSGVGLLKTSQHPAGALLFAEYLLTDAQPLYSSLGRVPPDEFTSKTGRLAGAEFRLVDPKTLEGESGEKWRKKYEEVVAHAGETRGN